MIDRLTIQNFKSLGDVTIDLDPTTVLIGRSGVGKSNVLRAVRFLRNYLTGGDHAVQQEGGWGRLLPFGRPAPLRIEVVFHLPGFDQPFTYVLGWPGAAHPGGNRLPDHEQLRVGTESLFGRSGGNWLAGSPQVPLHPASPIALGQFPAITEAVLSFSALTDNIGWHDFPASVLTATPPSNGASPPRGLGDAASNFLAILRDLTQDLRDQSARRQIVGRLRQINPSVKSVELNSVLHPANVIVTHRLADAAVSLDLSQESDGFRRYYAHLLALYQTPPRQVLMFEEPENGVAPGALRNLAEEFLAAPNANRGQILLTTQSPDLLDGFTPEQMRVVELDPGTQLTRVGRLDRDQVAAVRDHLLHPGELLTVDLARRDTEAAVT